METTGQEKPVQTAALLPAVPPEATSSVAVARMLSKVLKIEPALFPGNRSHATVMFHGSLGCLYSIQPC